MQRFSSILRPIRLLLLPAFGLLMPACEEADQAVLDAQRIEELREIYQVGIDAIDANYPHNMDITLPMPGCDGIEYAAPPTRIIYDTLLGCEWRTVNINSDSTLSVSIAVYENAAVAQYRIKVRYDTMAYHDRIYPIFMKSASGQWEVVGYQ